MSRITILTTVGPRLTKIFKADGSTDSYDDAASFKMQEVEIDGLDSLASVLRKLETKPKCCVIRGEPKPPTERAVGNVEGTWKRKNESFIDSPRQWLMIDIDKYRPGFADPVLEPELAVQDFIRDHLPAEFKGVSFHWQLSSSAGTPGKEGILKAHVWFWLDAPHTCAALYAWGGGFKPHVDCKPMLLCQINFTANPIFEEGIPDPVKVRSGLWRGARDDLPLVITPEMLALARTRGSGSGGEDMKLLDPRTKPGLIGAFHRVFDVEQVLTGLLDEFEQVTERRYTWSGGGGTPEGVWVHDDGLHVGSSHNTWPLDGIANLWDVVRVFKFGQLDEEAKTGDTFADMGLDRVGSRPSDLAMIEWAGQQPEVKEAIRKEREQEVDRCLVRISEAEDQHSLEEPVAQGIREAAGLTATDRERLAMAFQTRMRALTGVKLPIRDVRHLIAPERQATAENGAPEWAKTWVWVREEDGFMNTLTKRVISTLSYNASYDRFMGAYMDERGTVPRASDLALTGWRTRVVDQISYMPNNDDFFCQDGFSCANSYRADLVPEMPGEYNEEDLAAIQVLKDHAALMVPDTREAHLMLDWLAYCVQKPGAKIRWAVLLKGIPGDGKTAFATLLSHVMGHPNVRTLSSNTLEGSDFSGWGAGQCVVAIEEVKLQGHNRHDVFNKLKPFITNDVIEIHPKGRDPRSVTNTSNYFLLTNHNDAVPIDDNDRRVMPLWSPFLTKESLFKTIQERFGMSPGEYFDRLFDFAIKTRAGALRRWLMERDLSPEFKADGRAPITSVRELMVDISRADDEMAVLEMLETGGMGIYPGLVSVTHLAEEVRRRFEGVAIRTSRVFTLMSSLGYQPLPQMKWRNRNCRVYVRTPFPVPMTTEDARDALERLEGERVAGIVEADFVD